MGVICVSQISFGAAAEIVVVVDDVDDAARLFWRIGVVNAEDGFIVMMLWSTKH